METKEIFVSLLKTCRRKNFKSPRNWASDYIELLAHNIYTDPLAKTVHRALLRYRMGCVSHSSLKTSITTACQKLNRRVIYFRYLTLFNDLVVLAYKKNTQALVDSLKRVLKQESFSEKTVYAFTWVIRRIEECDDFDPIETIGVALLEEDWEGIIPSDEIVTYINRMKRIELLAKRCIY